MTVESVDCGKCGLWTAWTVGSVDCGECGLGNVDYGKRGL